MRHVAIAADGDVIAAGNFSRKFTLGDKSVEPTGRGTSVWVARVSASGSLQWLRIVPGVGDDRFVRGLAVAKDGRIVVDIVSDTAPRYVRSRVEPDGSKDSVETLALGGDLRAVVIEAEGTVVTGSLDSQTCRESSQLHRLDARGKVTWSACNDRDPEAESGGGEPHLEVHPGESVAFCATFRGHAPMWTGSKGPEAVVGTQAFIASFLPRPGSIAGRTS